MMESSIGILQADYSYIAENLDSSFLKGCTVLVTGATGLIGSNLVKALLCINRIRGLDLKVLAAVRNTKKAEGIFSEVIGREELTIVNIDIEKEITIGQKADYIIHAASNTNSKLMIEKPVDTITAAVTGTKNMLDYAVRCGCRKFVYISSMEMYGNVSMFNTGSEKSIKEDEVGLLDPLAVRSNYPESKRMCENMCIAYEKQYGLDVSIARLAQTFGPGISPADNRVFAQFARCALTGKNIVLHTKGDSEGNYCYLRDVLTAILVIASKGASKEAYNVCNEACHTTIAGMAEMVCREIMNDAISVEFDIPESNIYGYAQKTKMKLCSDKLKALGWNSDVGLEEAYRRTIEYLRVQE